jgi:hypothetical protein
LRKKTWGKNLKETFFEKRNEMKKVLALCCAVSTCLIISLGLSPFRSVATAEEGGVAGGEPQRRIPPDQAEQIALEFWNYRCEPPGMEPFIEQTEENRKVFLPLVKRYFENPANWEHIQNGDIDHFANEVFGEKNIPRSSVARAEIEKFLKDQIVKLPEIEAPPPPPPAPTVWQRIKASVGNLFRGGSTDHKYYEEGYWVYG